MSMRSVEDALAIVQRRGLLPLTTCGKLLGLTELVADAPIRGSWWAHSKAKLIFGISEALGDRDDVTVVKLVHGKRTFVSNEQLLPALLLVVGSDELRDRIERRLTDPARALLAIVETRGRVRLDEVATGSGTTKAREAAKLLESTLAVLTSQLHTESGKHETVLQSWRSFERERGCAAFDESVERALSLLRGAAQNEPLPALEVSLPRRRR